MSSFWHALPKPFFILAPMANVTDAAFRRIIARYGKPDVMFTEFTSCDGLCSQGREKLLVDFLFSESERPIVAQVFGATPEHFYQTALLIQELGFDGIDINMGCPDKNVGKQRAGAELINNPRLAKKIIRETQRGAGPLPVSVKTRIGITKNELATWLPVLLEEGLAAVTIHARTRREMSKVPAHWEAVREAVEIARREGQSKKRTLIIGNGDVGTLVEARQKIEETGADGIMIGRGVFGNPWLFNSSREGVVPTRSERLRALREHLLLFDELLGKHKRYDSMKKHFKAYISGYDGAKELRVALMETQSPHEAVALLEKEISL